MLASLLIRLQHITSKCWLLASLLLAVLGARLAAFNYAGSPLPYFDQWMAEFDNGFLSASRGTSLWQTLTRSHNEHLLLTTKLLSLLGFSLNGYWDVHFLAVASTVVRAIEAGAMFALLTCGLSRRAVFAIWVACLVVFAAPISGFNLLCGLQVSFFFADLALVASLALLIRWENSWREVALLTATQLFGLLSFGSALVIPACTAAAALLLRVRTPRFWFAWILTAALGAIYVLTYHDFGAGSGPPFRPNFLLQLVSWPFSSPGLGAAMLVTALVAVWWRWRAGLATPAHVASVSLLLFALLNATLIALSRRPEEFHHRHWDTLALFPLAFVALGAQLTTSPLPRLGRTFSVAVAVFAISMAVAIGWRIATTTWPYMSAAHMQRSENVERYRALLLSGRIQDVTARINEALAEKNYEFFDGAFDRYAMPPIATHNYLLKPLPALSLLSPDIIPAREPSVVTRGTKLVVDLGAWLLLPALLAALFAWRPTPLSTS